ncbi:MAG: hypothetical protein M3Y69_06055 [Verrucomicrobiota bacterium]|nr:hypothetical protein [Verrucomicrobiota bacterium]
MKSEAPPTNTKQVAYNTRIDFSKTGNAASLKVSGWSKAEDKFTWSEGNTAVLALEVAPTPNPVILRVTAAGMINEPAFATHPVEVYANDQRIADWQVGNTAPFSAPIPVELTKAGGPLTITFKMPKAVSPKDLGKSEDPRVLGICVFDLELTQG